VIESEFGWVTMSNHERVASTLLFEMVSCEGILSHT